MASFVGRSGADATFKALHHICIVIQRYGSKLVTAVDLTLAAGLITSDQATAAKTFIVGSRALCDIFDIIAKNSGFN